MSNNMDPQDTGISLEFLGGSITAMNSSSPTNSLASFSNTTTPNSFPTPSSLPPQTAVTTTGKVLGLQPIPKKSALIKTDKPRPHVCTICTRAFARLEHLKRHERSHTNEKPFQCAACGRCFARRDLVLRHQQKLHASLPNVTRRTKKLVGEKEEFNSDHINILQNNTDPNAPLQASNGQYQPQFLELEKINEHPLKERQNSSGSSPGESLQDFTPPQTVEFQQLSNNSSNEFDLSIGGGEFVQPHVSTTNHHSINTNKTHTPSTNNHPSLFGNFNISGSRNNSVSGFESNTTRRSSVRSSLQQPSPQASITPPDSRNNSTHLPLRPDHFASKDDLPHRPQYRHSSFSASSLTSYTTQKVGAAIQSNNNIPEAPRQVGFATPQMTAVEMMEKATMSGLDIDALGLDWHMDDIDKLNLNNMGDSKTSNPNGEHRLNTAFEFNMNSGASGIDIPMLQQFLQVGSGGGGAGFDDNMNGEDELKTFLNDNKNENIKREEAKNEDWLKEFVGTPFDVEFTNSNPNNFSQNVHLKDSVSPGNSINSNSPRSDDIPNLFRNSQINLFKQLYNSTNGTTKSPNSTSNEFTYSPDSEELYLSGTIFSEELRNRILLDNNLNNLQFPPLENLNSYIKLFEKECDKYFPFIHLPSLKATLVEKNYDNIPLLLAMSAIGSLYAFHSSNSLLLFNISRYQIHYFIDRHSKNFSFDNVPLWVHQSLVLHMFLGMFNNNSLDMVKTTSRQIDSLVGLMKSTSLNQPLEKFLLPPPTIDSNNNNPTALQNNYDYFILAQSRIRTVHTLYMISVLRSALIGSPTSLNSNEIMCGTPCYLEELWRSATPQIWYERLNKHNLKVDSKFSLIEISNGEPLTNVLNDLDTHYCDKKLSFKTLLTLLMTIYDKIYNERSNSNNESNGEIKAAKWRLNSRPYLESLIKSWEIFFVRNGGVLVTNEKNLQLIKQKPVLKLVLPLLYLAKIRLCIHLTPIMEKIWYKEWSGMNDALKVLDNDPEALRESTGYSLDILKLWVDHISIMNNAEKTSVRTPIFFVTCIFTAVLIIADYLYTTEVWAQNYNSNKTSLNAVDRVLWLKSETLLKEVEKNLLPKGSNNSSYSEFLRMQANGALDVEKIDDELAKLALDSGIKLQHTADIIIKARLSSRALSLGVRILADAPVWPVAMSFAEALKARAIHISKLKTMSLPGVV